MEQLTTNDFERQRTKRWPRVVGAVAASAALTGIGIGAYSAIDQHNSRCGVEMTNTDSTYRIFGLDHMVMASYNESRLNIDGQRFPAEDIPDQYQIAEDQLLIVDREVDEETGGLVSVTLICQET